MDSDFRVQQCASEVCLSGEKKLWNIAEWKWNEAKDEVKDTKTIRDPI